jgi:ubiquinone/menaquinone biosynthesis C-methylase UbiE
VIGFDISSELLRIARRYERREPLGISYRKSDAQSAKGIRKQSFDGAVCVLALMHIPNLEASLQTIRRILKPGAWLVLVITHPCFEAPEALWLPPEETPYRAVRGYFSERYWKASSGGVTSLVGQYHRKFSTYLNTLIEAGFAFERMEEPVGAGLHAAQVLGSLQVPRIVLVRARIPERSGR